MEELRACFMALMKKNGPRAEMRQRLAEVLAAYERAVAAVAALGGGRLAAGSAAMDAVDEFVGEYKRLILDLKSFSSDALLTSTHYDELILPVLRAADAATAPCPTNLLGISRPCTLSLPQRREAVHHVCRLVGQLPAGSLENRMVLEMLYLLMVDAEEMRPLPRRCVSRAPPPGSSMLKPGMKAAAEEAALRGAFQLVGVTLAASTEAAGMQAMFPGSDARLVPILDCMMMALVKDNSEADAAAVAELERMAAMVASNPALASRLVQLLRSSKEFEQEMLVRVMGCLAHAAAPPTAGALYASLRRAGAGPALRAVLLNLNFAPGAQAHSWVEEACWLMRQVNSAAAAPPPRRVRRLDECSEEELRGALAQLGIGCEGCLDKAELVRLLRDAYLAAGPRQDTPTTRVVRQLLGTTEGRLGGEAAARGQPGSEGSDSPWSPSDTSSNGDEAAEEAQPGDGGPTGDPCPARACATCGATPGGAVKLRLCACRLVRYCCERCQSEDWPGHKAACKEARRRQRSQAA